MPIKVLLVDEDELFAESVLIMLNKSTNFEFEFDIASNSKRAFDLINSKTYDLYIIEITLNNQVVGFDLASRILDNSSPIIFTSSFTNVEFYNKIMTFKNSLYLVKPFHEFTLDSSVNTLLQNIKLIDSNSYFKINNQLYLFYDSIIYFEVENNYCTIQTMEKKHVVKNSLSQILNNLPNNTFIQIHRNYVVNIHQITSVDFTKLNLTTTNQKLLPISHRKVKALKSALN